jgi:hypothetical protein
MTGARGDVKGLGEYVGVPAGACWSLELSGYNPEVVMMTQMVPRYVSEFRRDGGILSPPSVFSIYLRRRGHVRRLGDKVVAFRRQNRVRQLKDTWQIGFLYASISISSLLK